jgi:hypothetical protein
MILKSDFLLFIGQSILDIRFSAAPFFEGLKGREDFSMNFWNVAV